jgi:trk system potassium uptake protein TrkH
MMPLGWRPPKPPRTIGPTATAVRRRRVPAALRVIVSLLLLVLIGALLLMVSGAGTSQRLTFQDALFTAVSALAVTGLSTITPSTDLTFFGQVVLMGLIQIGGIGFMVLAVGVLRGLRRQVSLLDRQAMRDSLGLSEAIEFRTILRRVLVSMLAVESVGAVLLWLHWRSTLGDETAAFYGLFHAVSAFCNAGFSLFSPAQFPAGIPRDTLSLTILGGLIVCGGLGFPVLADVVEWPTRRRLSLHTRLTISVSAILIAVGAIGLLLAENRSVGGALHGVPWHQQVVLSVFQSISARTAGFSVMANMQDLTAASQVLLIGLMFIGTAPASMGGGITTGTFVVLALAMWSYARRWQAIQVQRRRIPADTVRRAAAVLLVALLVVLGATWLILLEQPAPLDSALDSVVFEVVSAFSTTGLSLSYTTQLSGFGLIVIMLCMLWGRLGALTIIAALGEQLPPERVEYPEERLLLG